MTPKIKISVYKLRQLILEGITSEELNSRYDYSKVTDMSCMFDGCSELRTIPHLDTSNVLYMDGMFDGCSELRTIPHLDTSNVLYMDGMFWYCSELETIPHLDTSRVEDMRFMFDGCNKLRDFDPYNFPGYDFSRLPENEFLRTNYPELFI